MVFGPCRVKNQLEKLRNHSSDSLIQFFLLFRKVIIQIFKALNSSLLSMLIPDLIKFCLYIFSRERSTLYIRNQTSEHFYTF